MKNIRNEGVYDSDEEAVFRRNNPNEEKNRIAA
jgi:hypothetical protein